MLTQPMETKPENESKNESKCDCGIENDDMDSVSIPFQFLFFLI